MIRYFLTVDWCNNNKRGIFCAPDGGAFSKEVEHTTEEMDEILGIFTIILAPRSLPFNEITISKYTKWLPLGEYSNQYGIALKA